MENFRPVLGAIENCYNGVYAQYKDAPDPETRIKYAVLFDDLTKMLLSVGVRMIWNPYYNAFLQEVVE